MRLLICTQAVDENDSALGFAVGWFAALAESCASAHIVCLREGMHDLPQDVRVTALGTGGSLGARLRIMRDVIGIAWRERHAYDAVFVHMNPEYLVVAGWLWRLLGKRTVLWYTHRQVTAMLRAASVFTNAIATAAPESFRLPSHKLHVLGHGIDVARFAAARRPHASPRPLDIVSVGRITPIKKLDILIEAAPLLRDRGDEPVAITLIGTPVTRSDESYAASLQARARELGLAEIVRFVGPVLYANMPDTLSPHSLAVNLSPTGGIDKAVLEALAAGLVPVVANEAFRPLLAPHDNELCAPDPTPASLASAILRARALSQDALEELAVRVEREWSVKAVVKKIMQLLSA